MATAYEFRKGGYWHRRLSGGGSGGTPATGCFLLLESGDYLLLESGDKLELEGCATPTTNLLLLESSDALLLESGDGLALEG